MESTTRYSRRAFLRMSVVAASGSLVAACAPAAPTGSTPVPNATAPAAPSGAITLTYTNYSTGADKSLWDDLIGNFQAKFPNIKVTYLPIAGESWGEYFDKVSTMIAGGNPPDVVRVAIEGTQLFVAKGLATPLDDFMKGDAEIDEFLQDVNQQLLDVFKVDGKTWELPFDWNNMVMFYNTRLFQEAGLDAPREDWTFDQWLETAGKLTKRGAGSEEPEVFGFGTAVQYFAGVMPWIFNAGGNLLSDNWTTSKLDSPEVLEAVTFMRDLIWTHKVAPQAPPGHTEILNLAAAGKLAMWGGGRWPTLTLTKAGFYDFDIQYWPRGATQTTEFGVGGFTILKSSRYPREAWTWLKFLTTKEAFSVITRLGQSIPARRSLAKGPEMFELPPKQAHLYYESIESRPAKPVPSPPQYNRVEAVVRRYLGQILANEVEPAAGLNAAHEEVSQILKS